VTVLCETTTFVEQLLAERRVLSRKGTPVEGQSFRILVVDDYEPWRRFVASILHQQPGLLIVGEASDGLSAVEKAQELQPDLILLDIGLPKLNGIQAARQIRELAPKSKIVFISENRSWDIAEEALRMGAIGYVVKSDAASELLPASEVALQGKQFVSSSLAGHHLANATDERSTDDPTRKKIAAPLPPKNVEFVRHHEVEFYSDDRRLLDDVTQFIGAALKAGNAAVVAATESHRHSLLPRLLAYGLDIGEVIEQGRYIALDAADTLSIFMVNGIPDPVRFMEAFSNLVVTAGKTATGEHPRVAVFGECVNLLCAQGDPEAAIQMEKLGNQLANLYDVDILCGYSLAHIQAEVDTRIFEQIRAEHSAVYPK
jgi:DNA-binding NarL/FixJ family response regulator